MGRGSRQVGASLLQNVSSSVLTSCVPPPSGLQLQPLPSCSCSIALRCIALAPVCRGWLCVLSRLSSCRECAAWPSCCYPIEGSNITADITPTQELGAPHIFPTALSTSSCIFCHTSGRTLKGNGTYSNRTPCNFKSRPLSEHHVTKQTCRRRRTRRTLCVPGRTAGFLPGL